MPGLGMSDVAKTDAESRLDQIMDRALDETNQEHEDTIALFRAEFTKVANFEMLMALIGPAEFHNSICRLRAKRVRTRNIMQTNAARAARKTQ